MQYNKVTRKSLYYMSQRIISHLLDLYICAQRAKKYTFFDSLVPNEVLSRVLGMWYWFVAPVAGIAKAVCSIYQLVRVTGISVALYHRSTLKHCILQWHNAMVLSFCHLLR